MNKYLLLILSVFVLSACTQQDTSNNNPKEPVIEFNAGVGIVTGSGDFGDVTSPGSKLLTFKITNTGDAALQGPPIIDSSDFTIAYANGCDNILPKKICQLKINFSAKGKTAGFKTANLNLDSAFIALSANVIDSNISTDVSFSSGESLDFGTITDKQSVIKTITVTNSGSTTITEPIILGANFINSYDACSNKILAPKKTCQVKITLSGSGKNGNITDTIQFGGKSIALLGVVASSQGSTVLGSPVLSYLINSVVQTNYDMATLSGNKTAQAVINLTNTGTAASTVSTAGLSGGAGYSIAFNQCSNISLAKNATCQIRVIFASSGLSAGTYSTQLSFGSAVLTLNSVVEVLTTYQPIYSSYGNCSSLLACAGPGTQSRVISTCNKLENGVAAGTADISNCASFAVAENLDKSCSSPAGQATQPILGGEETRSCSEGQSYAQGSFVSVSCESGYHENGSICESDGPVVMKNLVITNSGVPGASINVSPNPSSSTSLSSTQTKYEFPQNTSVAVSVSSAGTIVLDSYSGDCSGLNCSVILSENKAVVVTTKDSSSKFITVETNSNLIPQCFLENGIDLRSSGLIAYQSKEGCEQEKNVSWHEFDCGSFSNESSCQGDSYGRCFWNMGGGPGGGDPFMCQMMYGGDEFMCNMEGSMFYGCHFDYGMGMCTAGSGGGSCQGGQMAFCRDIDNNYNMSESWVTSSADCTPEKTKGTYLYSSSTIGGIPDSGNQSNLIELNGKVYFNSRKDYTGNGQYQTMFSSVDLITNQLVHYPQVVSSSYNIMRNVTKFNNKIYYLEQDLNVNSYIIKSFDGVTATTVANITSDFSGRFFAMDDILLVFHNTKIAKIDLNNNYSILFNAPNNFLNYTDSNAAITRTKDYAYMCVGMSNSVGSELYKVNSSGVTLVTDLNGSLSGCFSAQMMDVVDYDNNIITYLATPTNTSQPHLYVSNGTSGGTYSLMSSANSNAAPLVSSYMKPFYSSEIGKIFTAQNYGPSYHWEPFLSNPSVTGSTVLAQDLNSNLTSQPYTMGQINGKVVFYGYNGGGFTTDAIYATNGTNVEVLMSGIPHPSSSLVQSTYYMNMYSVAAPGVNINGKIYFIIGFNKLYESDGTVAGTKLVKDYSLTNENAWFYFARGNKMYIYKSGNINFEKGYELEIFNPSL